jgi:alpha-glucoside transport system permease protein
MEQAEAAERSGFWGGLGASIGRLLVSLFVPLITFGVLYFLFRFLRDTEIPKGLGAIIAIVWGVGGALALFFVANFVVEQFSDRWKRRLTPFIFVGPALVILGWYLALTTVRSFYASLFDASGEVFVGLENYVYAFTSPPMLQSFRNNAVWLVVGTGFAVGFGLLIAVLADRTHPRFETIAKSFIFMPYAVSMVGASIIFRFIYSFKPTGEQIGLLNAVVVALGGKPQAWLLNQPWNTLFLIVILIWIQTGYAMVIISAGIKGIPGELLEAARIDGANERQVLTRIMIPYIQGTLVTVATTIILFTLKIFDIVQSMTGGNFGTQVIANEQYTQMFRAFHFGRGAAIAIVLLVLVIPVMWYNLREFSERSEAF